MADEIIKAAKTSGEPAACADAPAVTAPAPARPNSAPYVLMSAESKAAIQAKYRELLGAPRKQFTAEERLEFSRQWQTEFVGVRLTLTEEEEEESLR